jgi:hypothetical protein
MNEDEPDLKLDWAGPMAEEIVGREDRVRERIRQLAERHGFYWNGQWHINQQKFEAAIHDAIAQSMMGNMR